VGKNVRKPQGGGIFLTVYDSPNIVWESQRYSFW